LHAVVFDILIGSQGRIDLVAGKRNKRPCDCVSLVCADFSREAPFLLHELSYMRESLIDASAGRRCNRGVAW
jgi:hypothetical protein